MHCHTSFAFRFAFSEFELLQVAITAILRVIRVLRGENLLIFAGIEAKYLCFVLPFCIGLKSGSTSPLDCFFGIALGIASRVDLNGVTSAIPTIWRKKFVPELITWRQGYTVEKAVLLPHSLVLGGSILQEEVVSVFGDFLPACRCLRGGDGEVVFGLQIGLVVIFINLLNVA